MPSGYLWTLTFIMVATLFALPPPRRPAVLPPVNFHPGLVLNELPFLVFCYLLAPTLFAIGQGDLHSPDGWVGFGVAVLTTGGLVVVARRGLRAGPALHRALREELETQSRAAIDPATTASLPRRLPGARVRRRPVLARRNDVRRVADIRYGPARERNTLHVHRRCSGTSGVSMLIHLHGAELRRIERDLHDGAQARIVAAGMTLALASRKLGTNGDASADVELARRQLDGALAELRRLARGIHPPVLTDRGLHAALAVLAGDSPLAVELRGDPTERYPAAVESAAYFVVAEGLTNAGKHAEATTGMIKIARVGGTVRVTVTDDGRGGADPAGSGIDGLRRRVEALGGRLTLISPSGGPTILYADLPCAS